jgi:alkylation response protein AidB-like acyl-CoA dehydrogenase
MSHDVTGVEPLADAIHRQLGDELAELAPRIDQDGFYPKDFLHRLGAAGGFGACVPAAFGGAGAGLDEQIAVTTAIARTCGSTAFLVWCQSVSAWYLLHTPNQTARDRYLEAVATGALLSGSGMSNAVKHLAGIEKIHLRATRDGDDYVVNGILPWVSNLDDGHLLIVAAQVPDSGYVMFAVPCNAPGLSLHACPDFSGMEGTGTLNPRFDNVRIDAGNVLAHPHQFEHYMARIKPGFVLGQTGMGLGVVEGSLADIRMYNRIARSSVNTFLDDQDDTLATDLAQLKADIAHVAAQAEAGNALPDVMRLRANASELALRAANSATLHAGARGYLLRSPVQRRLREAVFVSIVTPSLKHLRKCLADLDTEARAEIQADEDRVAA